MEYIFILFFIAFAQYLFFIAINIYSFLAQSESKIGSIKPQSVSVIIAIRNGEQSLPNLIKYLKAQDYKYDIEFLLVEDDSVDRTKEIIKSAEAQDSRIRYISSDMGSNDLKFKKRALDAGIQNANHEILLFTDVDCEIGKSWASAMVGSFNDNIDYVIGFSRVRKVFGLANLFQRIDFLMLMFSAKAVAQIGWPLACSGQNQAYRKSFFKKVGGYQKISHLLMGDDSVFLQLCLKNKAKVKFCKNSHSYVFCRSEKKWKDLFLQRMRWAGDGNIMWKYNFLFYTIMLSTVLSNLFILILIFSCSFNTLIIILLMKLAFEGMLAILGATYFQEKISGFNFIYWYLLNIPYICIMSVSSFFVKFFPWQNRKQ